jgi:hypothetical protein
MRASEQTLASVYAILSETKGSELRLLPLLFGL